MKRRTLVSLFTIGLFLFGITAVLSSFGDPVLTSSLRFSAQYSTEKNTVEMSWDTWEKDFMWYKVVRSQTNPDPVYPEDGHIYYSDNQTTTEYVDKSPPRGKTFYRVCAIAHTQERFCSNVVSLDISQAEPADEIQFCIQVITPAKNKETGECKEFPTPCDVPNNWEKVNSCPSVTGCEEGIFSAKNKDKTECKNFQNTCDIPLDWSIVSACENSVTEECIDNVVGINLVTGECTDFSSSCDMPSGWKQLSAPSCQGAGNISLMAIKEGEKTLLRWDASGIPNGAIGFKILQSETSKSPVYPVKIGDTSLFIEGRDAKEHIIQVTSSVQTSYRACAYSDDICFPYSNTVLVSTLEQNEENKRDEGNIIFSDVSAKSEMGKSILEYAEKNVVKGFSDGTFKAEKGVTRAEMAKIATLAVGVSPPHPSARVFCDIPLDEWFAPFIHYFSENGYAEGFVGGGCILNRFFSPHNPVLRGEAIKMIFEITNTDVSLLNQSDTTGFSDVSADHWLAPYAKKAWEKEVFRGFDDGTFRPDEPATRGEVLLYLSRIQKK